MFGHRERYFINTLKEFQQFTNNYSAHTDENQYDFLTFEKSGNEIKISGKKIVFHVKFGTSLRKP